MEVAKRMFDKRVSALFETAENIFSFIDEVKEFMSSDERAWYYDFDEKAWIREIASISINGYDEIIIKSKLDELNAERKGDTYWIKLIPGYYIGLQFYRNIVYIFEKLACPEK